MGRGQNIRLQRGVALITAMLITVLVTILTTGMKSREAIDVRRAMNVQFNEQAFYYLLGAEDWAKHILARDIKDSKIDSLDENWAKQLPPVPIDGGQIGGQLFDLQGRFNINNLASAAGTPDKTDKNKDENKNVDILRFQRLLSAHDLPTSLVDAVIDWLDPDGNTRFPNGAEDVAYLQLDPPYRAANTLMASPSELLRVKGFDYEAYQKIAPLLVALPEHTEINVNTALPGVLQMVVEDLSDEDAKRLADELAERPVESVTDFLNNDIVAGKKVDTKGLTVSSQYFLLSAYAQVGDIRSSLASTLQRKSDKDIRTVRRSREGV
jgi:general secretion pathway protein K